jgi:hypothetical protein
MMQGGSPDASGGASPSGQGQSSDSASQLQQVMPRLQMVVQLIAQLSKQFPQSQKEAIAAATSVQALMKSIIRTPGQQEPPSSPLLG